MSSPTKSCEHFYWCATVVSERTLETFCLPFALCGSQASGEALIRGLSRHRLTTTCCPSPPIANTQTTHPSSYLHTSLAKWIHFHFPHVSSKGSIKVKCWMKSQLCPWLVIVKFAAARVGGGGILPPSTSLPIDLHLINWILNISPLTSFWLLTPAENWPEDIWGRPPR